MPQQRHFIKTQILEVQVGSKLPTSEIQNEVSALYRNQLLPLLEGYCDQISPPDTVLRIDTLEINLSKIELQALRTDFVAKVREQLGQRLAKKLDTSAAALVLDIPAEASAPRHPPNNFGASADESTANSPTDRSKSATDSPLTDIKESHQSLPPTLINKPQPPTTPTASKLETLSYFLRTGLLPWWSHALSPADLENCWRQLLTTSPTAVKGLLLQQLKHSIPLQRLIYQFSDQTLNSLMSLLVPGMAQWLPAYIQDMQTLMPQTDRLRGVPPHQLRLTLWQGLFSQGFLNPSAYGSARLAIYDNLLHLAASLNIKVSTCWRQLGQTWHQLQERGDRFTSEDWPAVLAERDRPAIADDSQLRAVLRNLVKPLSALKRLSDEQSTASSLSTQINALLTQLNALLQNAPSQPIASSLKKTILAEVNTLVTTLETENIAVYHALTQQIKTAVQAIDRKVAPPQAVDSSRTLGNQDNPFNDSEEIYIQNSGLILLWPFLTRFFRTINLVENNQFIHAQAAEQAVLILQYLVDATTEIPEHLLPLNKILCGLDITETVPIDLVISDSERDKCDGFLTAVIHNWAALKNTSIGGLRQMFLQREGILRPHHDGWLLQVDYKNHDILIDQLPWSIQVIKLPWMDQVLYSEWSD